MGTKWLVESGLKLPKILRDMFTALRDRVKWRADIIQNLETVGYIHGGTQDKFSLFLLLLNMIYIGRVMMLMSLDNPDGYVMRLALPRVISLKCQRMSSRSHWH